MDTFTSPDGQYTSPSNLESGNYRLQVKVVDSYGLMNTASYSICIDREEPEFTSVNAPSLYGQTPRISISVRELILEDLYYRTNLTGNETFEIPSFSPNGIDINGDVNHHFSFQFNESIWNNMEHSQNISITIVAEDLLQQTMNNISMRKDLDVPTITNISINGLKRPITLPTIYISNYSLNSWDIEFTFNKDINHIPSYLKFRNGSELTRLSPTKLNSITFRLNNDDLPKNNQDSFLMDIYIMSLNGTALIDTIYLNLIRSAPEIFVYPYTNGDIEFSSSSLLEKISLKIENENEFVYEGIFQNRIFDLTSYMPDEDGSKTIHITIHDLSGFNNSFSRSIIVDRECPDYLLKQNGQILENRAHVNNWDNITYHCINDANNFAPPIKLLFEITEREKNKERTISTILEDAAGNVRHKEFIVVYDNIKPQVTYLGDHYYGNQTPTLNFAVYDENPLDFTIGFDSIINKVNISESGNISIDLNGWDNLNNGFHKFYIKMTDKAGNVYQDTIQIYKVSDPPQVILKYPDDNKSYKSSKHPTFNLEFQSSTDVLCILTIGNKTDNETFYYTINKNDGLLWNQPLPYWPYESKIEVTLTLIDEFNNSVEETWIMYRTDVPGFVRDNNLNFINLFTEIPWQVWIIIIVNIGLVLLICFKFKDKLITRKASSHLGILVSIGLGSMIIVSTIPSVYDGFLIPWATYWIPQLIIMQVLIALVTAIIGLTLIGIIKWVDGKRAFMTYLMGLKKSKIHMKMYLRIRFP